MTWVVKLEQITQICCRKAVRSSLVWLQSHTGNA